MPLIIVETESLRHFILRCYSFEPFWRLPSAVKIPLKVAHLGIILISDACLLMLSYTKISGIDASVLLLNYPSHFPVLSLPAPI